MKPDDLIRARQKRGNRIFLVILLVVVTAIFALSFFHINSENKKVEPKTVTAHATLGARA